MAKTAYDIFYCFYWHLQAVLTTELSRMPSLQFYVYNSEKLET